MVSISSQFSKEKCLSRIYLPGENIILFRFIGFHLCVMLHQIGDQIIIMQSRFLPKQWSISQGFA